MRLLQAVLQMSARIGAARQTANINCVLQGRSDASPPLAPALRPSQRRGSSSVSAVSVPSDAHSAVVHPKVVNASLSSHAVSVPSDTEHLSAGELFREIQIARMSGYCYDEIETLKSSVAQEGLKVIAAGDTYFTRWYIAEGELTGAGTGSPMVAMKQSDSSQPRTAARLHIFMRGVMWRSTELNSARVWQQLSQSWAVPFSTPQPGARAPPAGAPGVTVTSHKGVTDMANELFTVLDPYVKAYQGPITLAGHSLGGTLAKLLAARLVLERRLLPADAFCHTYGSPAAFSTSCGGRGTAVMRQLGLRDAQVRNWVLDHDPIPRAWTEANPYLQTALQVQALKSVYEWSNWAAKALGTTPVFQRLLFRNVGDVYILTHDAAATDGIRYVPPADIEAELARRPAPTAASAPFPGPLVVAQVQQMLEHSHRSYTHDLLIAARLRQRREERVAATAAAGAAARGAVGDGRVGSDAISGTAVSEDHGRLSHVLGGGSPVAGGANSAAGGVEHAGVGPR
eukprot:jgi/Ulvmu1/8411/UM042_0118.1